MKRLEQVVVIFIAAGLAIPSYWFFWTLAGGGGYEKRVKPFVVDIIPPTSSQTAPDLNKP
tara:strand:+ start:337 stop:516 length:180 start_codon:yes stop_codon:yes gene_type:complete